MKQTAPPPLEGELLTPCPHCYGFVEDHVRDGLPGGDCQRGDPSERLGELAERTIRAAGARARSPLGIVALAIFGAALAGAREVPRRGQSQRLRRTPKSRRP